MKIINKSANMETDFSNIKAGEAFYYQWSSALYLKTETIRDDDGTVIVNAVNLKTGDTSAFVDYAKVVPIECECVITNSKGDIT